MNRKKCNLGLAQDVPMLTDAEHDQVLDELRGFKREAYAYANEFGCSFNEAQKKVPLGQRALGLYEQITGQRLDDPAVLYSVRLSKWGGPCPQCGRAFATPRAKICIHCSYHLPAGELAGPA